MNNDKTAAAIAITDNLRSRQFADSSEWADAMIAEHEARTGQRLLVGDLFDQLRDGLGTAGLTLEMALGELRHIRETSNYEVSPKQ